MKSNIWSNFAYLSVCIADPIAAITNDKLYCIGRSAMTFVSIDLHTKDFTKLDAPHDMPNIRQMIAYEGDLYAASDECVQKYDTLTREWSKVNFNLLGSAHFYDLTTVLLRWLNVLRPVWFCQIEGRMRLSV